MIVKYRSRLNTLPVELKTELASNVLQWGKSPASRADAILQAFKYYNVDVYHAGTGTNRIVVRYNNYALKIALDEEGIADNMQEWAVSPMLSNGVSKSHEISGSLVRDENNIVRMKGGHLLVATYIPPFLTYGEMATHQKQIISTLKKWSSKFFLGDVGFQQKNFANWGFDSKNNRPVCIDYAYIFPADTNLYKCLHCSSRILEPDSMFTSYSCPVCKKRYEDRELRMRISNEQRIELFSKVKGISMTKEYEKHDISDEYKKNDFDPSDIYSIDEYSLGYDLSYFNRYYK